MTFCEVLHGDYRPPCSSFHKFQGILEDIDTKQKVTHSSYNDMEQLDFQILLTGNYYINTNSIHICFPMKIKKKNSQNLDIDADLITVNNLAFSRGN